MSAFLYYLSLVFYVTGIAFLTTLQEESVFFLLAFVFLHIIAVVLLIVRSRFFKRNGEKKRKVMVPFYSDYIYGRLVGDRKTGLRLMLADLALVIGIIGFFISLYYYSEWNILYFGYEGDMFVESIGGPYWIPMVFMIIFGILAIASLIAIVCFVLKLRKQKRELNR